MPNVFTVLGQDHEEVRQMLAGLENGPGQDAGATHEDVQARKAAVQALIVAESRHEAVEEEYFWPRRAPRAPGRQPTGRPRDQSGTGRQYCPGPAGQAGTR